MKFLNVAIFAYNFLYIWRIVQIVIKNVISQDIFMSVH